MQLNCLIFPAKQNTNIDHIKKYILLIPKDPTRKHIYYQTYLDKNNQRFDQLSARTTRIGKQYSKKTIAPISNMNAKSNKSEKQQTYLKQNCNFENISQIMQSLPLQNKGNQKTYSFQKEPSIKVKQFIPCMFLQGGHKLIIYFHGNAQDLGSSYEFLNYIYQQTDYSILAMQYQGYSIYQGESSSQKIERDAEYLIQYLLKLGFQEQNILILGRSIGSGPAIHASSKFSLIGKRHLAGLVLVSPFLSICELIKDKYGYIASMLVKERFINYKKIQKSFSPCLIIHGLSDNIIPFDHSKKLYEKSKGFCKLKLVEHMTHMSFDFRQDFLNPMQQFLKSIKF